MAEDENIFKLGEYPDQEKEGVARKVVDGFQANCTVWVELTV